MTDRPELNAELEALNNAVTAAIDARRAWMDAHMADYAEYAVGDDLYDLKTGQRLGTITKLYRPTWGISNPVYQTSMEVAYEYRHSDNSPYDNTSRQMYLSFGDRAELLRRRESELARLQRGDSIGGVFG